MNKETTDIITATNDLEEQKDRLAKRQKKLDKAQVTYDEALAAGEASKVVEEGLYHTEYEDRDDFIVDHAVTIITSNGGSTVVVEYKEGMRQVTP